MISSAHTEEYPLSENEDENLENALRNAGIPYELIAETCNLRTLDKISEKAMAKLITLKKNAIAQEDFDEAKRCHIEIESLRPIGETILHWEREERSAVRARTQ